MMILIDNVPKAEVNADMEHPSGALISSAHVANGMVSVLHGEKMREPSYTIGVLGRGTLNLPHDEFKQLLGSMAAIYNAMTAPKA